MSVPPDDTLAKAIIATIGKVVGEKLGNEQFSYVMVELEQVAYALIATATVDGDEACKAARMFGEHVVQRIMLREEDE